MLANWQWPKEFRFRAKFAWNRDGSGTFFSPADKPYYHDGGFWVSTTGDEIPLDCVRAVLKMDFPDPPNEECPELSLLINQQRQRKCLKCGKLFISRDSANRRCKQCDKGIASVQVRQTLIWEGE